MRKLAPASLSVGGTSSSPYVPASPLAEEEEGEFTPTSTQSGVTTRDGVTSDRRHMPTFETLREGRDKKDKQREEKKKDEAKRKKKEQEKARKKEKEREKEKVKEKGSRKGKETDKDSKKASSDKSTKDKDRESARGSSIRRDRASRSPSRKSPQHQSQTVTTATSQVANLTQTMARKDSDNDAAASGEGVGLEGSERKSNNGPAQTTPVMVRLRNCIGECSSAWRKCRPVKSWRISRDCFNFGRSAKSAPTHSPLSPLLSDGEENLTDFPDVESNDLPPARKSLHKRIIINWPIVLAWIDFLLYAFTLILVLYTSVFFQNEDRFYLRKELDQTLLKAAEGVQSKEDLWTWAKVSFVPTLFGGNDRFDAVTQSYRLSGSLEIVGGVTFRQLRVRDYRREFGSPDGGEEAVEWANMFGPWRSADETHMPSYEGVLHTYPGSGFVHFVSANTTSEEMWDTLGVLDRNDWIDSSSRALFINFVLWLDQATQAGKDRIGLSVQTLFEIPSIGGVVSTVEVSTFPVFTLERALSLQIQTMLLASIAFLRLVVMAVSVFRLRHRRRWLLSQLGLLFDLVFVGFVIAYVAHLLNSAEDIATTLDCKNVAEYQSSLDAAACIYTLVSLSYTIIRPFRLLFSIIAFLTWIRVLDFISLFPTFGFPLRVLKKAVWALTPAVCILIVTVFALGDFFYQLFGGSHQLFRSRLQAMSTLFWAFAGEFDPSIFSTTTFPVLSPNIVLGFLIISTTAFLAFVISTFYRSFQVVWHETYNEAGLPYQHVSEWLHFITLLSKEMDDSIDADGHDEFGGDDGSLWRPFVPPETSPEMQGEGGQTRTMSFLDDGATPQHFTPSETPRPSRVWHQSIRTMLAVDERTRENAHAIQQLNSSLVRVQSQLSTITSALEALTLPQSKKKKLGTLLSCRGA